MAVFLEAGTEDDHYDFLQLYIKRFRQERTRVARWCSSRSPSFSPSSSPESMDDDDDESDDVDDESMGRSLNDPEDGQELFIREIDYVVKPPHYTGVFHPYLWCVPSAKYTATLLHPCHPNKCMVVLQGEKCGDRILLSLQWFHA